MKTNLIRGSISIIFLKEENIKSNIKLQLSFNIAIYNIFLSTDPPHMFAKWAGYRTRMLNARKTYFSALRLRLNLERQRIAANMVSRIKKTVFFSAVGLTAYSIANEFYSEKIEKKKMKQKLMKFFPDKTYIISFSSDPMEILDYSQSEKAEDRSELQQLNRSHSCFIQEDNHENSNIKQKLGETIIIFKPSTIDQLSHILMRCHKYRHSAILGNYNIQRSFKEQNFKELKEILLKIEQPANKDKYVVVDLSEFKNVHIDELNDILEVQSGIQCKELNKILIHNGYQPLFQQFCNNKSAYEIIKSNIPLRDYEPLISRLANLTVVTAEGKKFKSSTEIGPVGQIPNLTPFFIGTGGAFAVPAKLKVQIRRQGEQEKEKYYSVYSENKNELALKWEKIGHYLISKRVRHRLHKREEGRLLIQINQSAIPEKKIQELGLILQKQNSQISRGQPLILLGVNNRILQKIIAQKNLPSFSVKNNVLEIFGCSDIEVLNKLVSEISLEGGVLIWSKDKSFYLKSKQKVDLAEVSAELMKKIVEVREVLDKKKVLYAEERYEQYYKKGWFRKFTEFFW